MSSDRVAITIVHGDIETEAEQRGLEAVYRAAEPYRIASAGTNDTTTLHIRREGVHALMQAITVHRRTWWKVRLNQIST